MHRGSHRARRHEGGNARRWARRPRCVPTHLRTTLCSDAILDRAFAWLCHQRRHWPDGADVWDFRRHWSYEKPRLQAALRAGTYQFDVQTRVTRADGETMDLWSARDALVLKALAWVLADYLPLSRRCTHLRGHGGSKGAVRAVWRHLPHHRFVLRTDVAAFYDSVDHVMLLDRLARYVSDRSIVNLVGQYLRRTAEWGGLYVSVTRGLSMGCPLSPLMGAFILDDLDARLARQPVFAVRFMDDVLVLAPTRWKLRAAVQVLNRTLVELRFEKHPGKTFIGRIERGFDFLGYHFTPQGLSVAPATWQRFCDRAHRLYERERGKPEGFPLLGAYVRRWNAWATGGTPHALQACMGRGLPA